MAASSQGPLLLVVGSVNYDLLLRHARLPGPGETVIGAELYESCGGKGANQAVAAARCARDRRRFPIRVAFGGAIGDDMFGERQRRVLEADGVELDGLLVKRGARTGTSVIWVEAGTGENRILNAPGANQLYLPEDTVGLPVEAASLLLLQNELPGATLAALIERAVRARVPVVWNPAPLSPAPGPGGRGDMPRDVVCDLPPECFRFITPNEVEAQALLGRAFSVEDAEAAARELHQRGYPGVVVTLGQHGAVVADGDVVFREPAPKVAAVDTTGAGDALNGAFAAALVAGQGLREAARFGVAYASASVLRAGVQDSFPYELPA